MDGRGVAIWAGVEPSVVRIGDSYVDQLVSTGHHHRMEDLDLIAELGVKTLRYPVLWERVAPDDLRSADWSWTDARLDRLRALGIEPIVTLLHHGSGPRYTELLDPQFPEKLARYARAVARRYPWLRRFTPVNEPLTTARFSALYGHWYPHLRDGRAFIEALLNQVRGIARAMEAICEEIPQAQLVQTEDLGKTHSTRELSYQAALENERRWTSTDLLTGSFERNELMQSFCRSIDRPINRSEIDACRFQPAILGFNYYVTSERFLDHRLERYPERTRGGNGRDRYADVEAVRVCTEGIDGAYGLLREAWERYERPLALTEAQLGCTREQQVRWLEELYSDAILLRGEGVDMRALTVWSLFGATDWDSLLTRREGRYECGAFDARAMPPRPTLIASWLRARANGRSLEHPAAEGDGWWRLPSRFAHGTASRGSKTAQRPAPPRKVQSRRIAIVGDGPRAERVAELCRLRCLNYVNVPGGLRHGELLSALRADGVWMAIDAHSPFDTRVSHAAKTLSIPLVAVGEAPVDDLNDVLDVALDGANGFWALGVA